MSLLRRIAPQTIAAQIACLVVVAVMLGVGMASAALLHFFYVGTVGANSDILPAVRAARIAEIVRKAQATHSPRELEHMLETARSPAVAVEEVTLAHLAAQPMREGDQPAFLKAIDERLTRTYGVTPLPYRGDNAIEVKVDDVNALEFRAATSVFPLHNLVLIQTTFALAIITVMIVLLSLYALKRITAPLSAIAVAARSFGRNPDESRPVKGAGPREITQVADALQEMRERTHKLVEERTQMLAAISHDLRTPLTRLRLRAERLSDSATRANMLQDIAAINDMVGETLAYLRDGARTEPLELIDLPSLLQTICAQFADIGHDVTYEGPTRCAFSCRSQSLSRAIANIVDNATKHGSHVSVVLRCENPAATQIEVSDNGPGIPPAWREKAFDPFFKADRARCASGRAGFGLGLSIARDIVCRQGGDIELLDHEPKGLTVRLSFGETRFTGEGAARVAPFGSAAETTGACDRGRGRRSESCRV